MRGERRDIYHGEMVVWLDHHRSAAPVRRIAFSCTLPRSVAQLLPREIHVVKPEEDTDE